MIHRKNVAIWVFAALAGTLFAVAPHIQQDADGGGMNYKLGGAWLRTSTLPPLPPGFPPLNPTIRSTITFVPTVPSGKKALITIQGLSVDIHAQGVCPDTIYLSDFVGEAVMTGPDTFEGTAVGYGMRPPTPEECAAMDCRDQIECIWVGIGETLFTSQDSATGTDYISAYYVGDRSDHPMLPDPEALPDVSLSLCIEDTRVPVMSPAELTPPWNLLGPCPYAGE